MRKAKRGEVTPEVQELAVKLMGREITKTELRLMVHIDYCLKNFHEIDERRLNDEDDDVLYKWQQEEHCWVVAEIVTCTREFYNILQEILWLAYVDYYRQDVSEEETVSA